MLDKKKTNHCSVTMLQTLRQSVTPPCSYKIHFSFFPLSGDIGLDGRQYFF